MYVMKNDASWCMDHWERPVQPLLSLDKLDVLYSEWVVAIDNEREMNVGKHKKAEKINWLYAVDGKTNIIFRFCEMENLCAYLHE